MHYTQLQPLYERLRARGCGFEVLAFPCNQFGSQEPGTPEEIRAFVQGFNVSFPMFEKCNVNGKGAHPAFRFVKGALPGLLGTSVKWNFTKFLVDQGGRPVKRYSPPTQPDDCEADIIALLDR